MPTHKDLPQNSPDLGDQARQERSDPPLWDRGRADIAVAAGLVVAAVFQTVGLLVGADVTGADFLVVAGAVAVLAYLTGAVEGGGA